MPEDDRTRELAARIQAARVYARMTQQELSEAMAVSLATVKRIESGTRPISTDELLQVAEHTGVPSAFMVNGWAAIAEGLPSETAQRLTDLERRVAAVERLNRRMGFSGA